MIEAICPFCETPFQVEDSLKGKTIRCPNNRCKQPFTVGRSWKEEPPPPRQQTGTVGEIIPVLPASPIEEKPSTPSWLEPPPIRGKPRDKQETGSVSTPLSPVVSQPPDRDTEKRPGQEIGTQQEEKPSKPSWLEPPPVRSKLTNNKQPAATGAPAPQDGGAEKLSRQEIGTPTPPAPAVPPKGVWIKRGIYGSLFLVICFLGAGAWYAWRFLHQTEEQLRAEAMGEYGAGNFAGASEKFGQLPEKFPESTYNDQYRFLKQLSDLRSQMHASEGSAEITLDAVSNFVFAHKKDPLFDPYHADLGTSLVHLLQEFIRRAKPATDETPLEVLRLAERVVRQVDELNGALTPEQNRKLREGFGEVRASVALWRQREEAIGELKALADNPTSEALRQARKLLLYKRETLGDDPRARDLVRRMYEKQLEQFDYDDTPPRGIGGGDSNTRPDAERVANLWVDIPLGGVATSPLLPVNERKSTLAVIRGVLYALSSKTGRVMWVHRVGVDTTALPIRIAADAVSDERILVLSADTNALTALDQDGRPVWSYALDQPCLGKPLVVGGRAFLPTVDGVVHEVELVRGRPLCRYYLRHRLTVGGVHEPGTSRIYFPADDSAVYAIDFARKRCRAILHTGHARGSLRGEPLLLPSDRPDTPGYLVLTHVEGQDETRLSTYRLPTFDQPAEDRVLADIPETGTDFWLLEQGQQHRIQRGWPDDPGLLRPATSVSGWTWFPPATDGEKLALVTDTGRLVLFGVRQPGNRDPLLFPWLPGADKGLLLESLGDASDTIKVGTSRGRCEVVELHGEDLWVLAQGVLRRVHMTITADKGPVMHPEWPRPLEVGFPFHESQLLLGKERGYDSPFVLVAQALESPQALALAVNRDNGDVLWKRQLGTVAAHDLVSLSSPDGKQTRLVMMDHAGSLLVLSPDQWDADKPWQNAGRQLAGGLAENRGEPAHLLRSADGRSLFQIACPGAGKEIVIRQVGWEKDKPEPELLHDLTFPASEPLTGTPGVMEKAILLPLGDAVLHKVSLPMSEKGERLIRTVFESTLRGFDLKPMSTKGKQLLPTEINWRIPGQGDNLRGFVVPLGKSRFLLTDGARSMSFYRHDEKEDQFVPLPTGQPAVDGRGKHVVQLPFSLMTPPVVVPLNKHTGILVADSSGTLTLFEQDADGNVKSNPNPPWSLDAPLTSGPYVYQVPGEPGRVLLAGVIQRDKFVWVDPESKEKPKQFDAKGEPIVGRPVWTRKGKLLVATQFGRLILLDPETGKMEESSWHPGGSLAPTAAPVVLGDETKEMILQPLTDGTMQLIPLGLIEGPASYWFQ